MNKEVFERVEARFAELKGELSRGNITAEEMRNELKELMIKDEVGNYWMIGGKSGQWYYYNGSKWIRKDPEYLQEEEAEEPGQEDLSAETRYQVGDKEEEEDESSAKEEEPPAEDRADSATVLLQQEEHRIEEEYRFDEGDRVRQKIDLEENRDTITMDKDLTTQQAPSLRTCKSCGTEIPADAEFCPRCGADRDGHKPSGQKEEELSVQYYKNEIEIKKIRLSSLIFLFGGFGIILGVIFGAVFGVLDIFGDLLKQFPSMLQEARGKLQGGLIFGALGGIFFSIVHMLLAAILGTLYNILSFILGGVKFKF